MSQRLQEFRLFRVNLLLESERSVLFNSSWQSWMQAMPNQSDSTLRKKSKRALILCQVPTPFLMELAKAINDDSSCWEMDVWFEGILKNRGWHWLDGMESKRAIFQKNDHAPDKRPTSLSKCLENNSYNALISLLPLHPEWTNLIIKSNKNDLPFVFWHERPLPRSFPVMMAKNKMYALLSKRLNMQAVWGIGYNAADIWSEILKTEAHVVPYFQDLKGQTGLTPAIDPPDRPTVFLFSGQLAARNNIAKILDAVKELMRGGMRGQFRMVFFGDGPERSLVEEAMDSFGPSVIELKSETPNRWIDRLNPLIEADILLSPGVYSGWGLTIPEALSLGTPVISSRGIEAARYYLRDGVNGLLADTSSRSIYFAMKSALTDRLFRDMAGESCIQSAAPGDVRVGRKVVTALLDRIT